MKIYYNDTYIDVTLEDDAKATAELMGDDVVQLHYKLPEWLEIPVGAKIEWQGKEYIMYEDMEFTENGTRSWDYQLKFCPPEYQLKHWKMRNPIDNRLQYTISVTPKMYIEHIVDALNKRDSGWRVGKVIDAPEQVVAFDHTFIWDSLIENADLFKTEMEIVGQTINFCKIEKNKNNPLPLAYGKGNGFVPGVGRKNTSDKVPFTTLFVQGGEQNINYSTYRSRFLLLPKRQSVAYDGEKFDHEEGFNSSTSRIYDSSADGLSITRQGVANNNNEDSLDLSSIYPNRLETILRVDVVDANKYWYDIVIDAPATLDYRNCQIAGETPTITFQSGMLGGKTFDLETKGNGEIICEQVKEGDKHIGWKLQLVPTEIDGLMMPGEQGYIPVVGDTLRLFGITLPQEYICDNINRSGASWDLFREAAKYMYDNEDKKFTFNGTLQAKWVRENYLNVMGYLTPGSYILFRDEQFDQEGVMVRVTAVSYPLNNPYEVELTISNEVEGKTAGSALRGLEQEKVKIPAREQDIIQYTQRGFRDVKETTNMLAQAIQGYDDGIKPIFVQTMQQIVGDEHLQYVFVDSLSQSANQKSPVVNYDDTTKQITMPQQYIQHRTLGITDIAPTHEYKMWRLNAYTSAVLSDADKAYYLYIKAQKSSQTANIVLSEAVLQDTSTAYLLLFAIVNKENGGTRSIVTLNGYTEVLPGRITTDKIMSADGNTYFDLVNNKIGGTIDFVNGLISGLILMKNKNNEVTAGLSGMLDTQFGYGGLKDVAFASGIKNYGSTNNANPVDAVVALTHQGYNSKIGVFRVDEQGIVVTSPDYTKQIVISNGSYDDYKPYSINAADDFVFRKTDAYNTTPIVEPLGDSILEGQRIALNVLAENFEEIRNNGEYAYITNNKYNSSQPVENYTMKRTYTVDSSHASPITRSGNYAISGEIASPSNSIHLYRSEYSQIGTMQLVAYVKLTVTPQLLIEKYDINDIYINNEIVPLTSTNNELILNCRERPSEGKEVNIEQESRMTIQSTNISLTGGNSYSVRLQLNYAIDYFCLMESRAQIPATRYITLTVENTLIPEELKLTQQLQTLFISPEGIKLPNGNIVNGN